MISVLRSRRKPHDWIPDQGWQDVIELSRILPDVYGSLPDDVDRNEKSWKDWYDHDTPEAIPIPGKYREGLSDFHKLCLLR